MSKTIRAALVYCAVVLGTGFVLGMFRVPILVPRIGERWAELGLAALLQNQLLAEFIGSRDKVSGSVYIALLLVFALMPRLRLSSLARSSLLLTSPTMDE